MKKRNEVRDGVGCKLTASFDTKIKKNYEMDKWAIFQLWGAKLLYKLVER